MKKSIIRTNYKFSAIYLWVAGAIVSTDAIVKQIAFGDNHAIGISTLAIAASCAIPVALSDFDKEVQKFANRFYEFNIALLDKFPFLRTMIGKKSSKGEVWKTLSDEKFEFLLKDLGEIYGGLMLTHMREGLKMIRKCVLENGLKGKEILTYLEKNLQNFDKRMGQSSHTWNKIIFNTYPPIFNLLEKLDS